MGVPGDMNLELLDYINDVEGLNWSKEMTSPLLVAMQERSLLTPEFKSEMQMS